MTDRIWTISNSISISRVLFLVPLAYCLFGDFENNRLWAAGVIFLATGTDFLDGFVARRLHQVSEMGKIVDPLADKIAVGTLALFLVILGDVPIWYVVAIFLRDVLILAGGIYIKKKKNIVTQSNWPGKFAVSAIALYLLFSTMMIDSLETSRMYSLWLSVGLMVFSLVIYAQRLFIGRQVPQGQAQ
jgi:CDP-diacylglycerol--glycerol-3-phosphate 3-phosphatidyltransferase